MNKLIPLCVLVLISSGCASMLPKEFGEVLMRPITDSVVAASAAAYHKKEGHWPRDINEIVLNKENKKTEAKKNDLDFSETVFIKNSDGSLTIDFDSSTDFHRKMILEPPASDRLEYVGTYSNVADSKYQTSGSISVDPTSEPMSVNIKSDINGGGYPKSQQ